MTASLLLSSTICAFAESEQPVNGQIQTEENGDSTLGNSNFSGEKQNPNTDPIDGEPEKQYDENETIMRAAKSESESNNTRSTADPISIGDTMTGTIGSASDIDCFVFTPSAAQKVTITLTGPTSSSYDYDLWLQDSNGGELARSDAAGSKGTITYSVKKGTKYYIVVNSAKGYGQKYTVKLTGSGSSTSGGSLGIKRFEQEKTKWCWAAGIQMMNYYEGKSVSQSSLATHNFGSALNKSLRVSEQVETLQWCDSSIFRDADYWAANTNAYWTKYIEPNYEKGHPTSLACADSENSTLGHTLLIDEIKDNGYVMLIDPWQGQTNRLRLTKDQLMDGFECEALQGEVVYSVACIIY